MPKSQLTPSDIERFEKQHYRVIGNHSAVKICGWTKDMIKKKGSCYKHKFYGIQSHRCLQMTTSISCANRCTFCWRDYKAPVSKDWQWEIDDPTEIIEGSIKAQKKLIEGFKGNPDASSELVKQSFEPKHVALSLTGEPITYPRFNELCMEFHKREISTFVVTNGQYPEAIENLDMVTQLYISVDAPNKEALKAVDKPLFSDYYERLKKSLIAMSKKPFRKAIRLTLIKDQNMIDLEGYKDLLLLGNPDFIEVKAYMWVGASRERLSRDHMPSMHEVRTFAIELAKLLPDYEIANEQEESWVVLLAKKTYNKKTWIDYNKFFKDLKLS